MTTPTFPTLAGLGFPVTRTPVFSTTPQVAFSGKDSRRANWTYPKHRYELTFDLLRSDSNAEWQTLMGFFMKVKGSALPFFFFDVDDNTAASQQFGIGDGITTQYQLVRSLGGFVEPVYAPIGTPSVSGGGLFSVSNGLVTFSIPPTNSSVLTWSGTFNWLCRFDADELGFEKFMKTLDGTGSMWSVGKASFTTVKP